MIGAERFRTDTCVDAAGAHGAEVRVAGLGPPAPGHGGVLFIDLRDCSGVLQLVIRPTRARCRARPAPVAEDVEFSARARSSARSADTAQPRIPTGAVEPAVTELVVLAEAAPLPFSVEDEHAHVGEDCVRPIRYLDTGARTASCARSSCAAGSSRRSGPCSSRGVPRGRDADADALDAEGARHLPGALAAATGDASTRCRRAAAVQAAVDGRRPRALRTRSSAASATRTCAPIGNRVHPGRHRGVLRRAGRHQRLVEAIMVGRWARRGSRSPHLPAHGLPTEAMRRCGTDWADVRSVLPVS